MAQTLSDGSVFNWAATGATPNGSLVVSGQRAFVALNTATGAAQSIACATEGVFSVACAVTGAMLAGEAAYYRIATTGTKIMKVCVRTAATGYLATGSNIKYARTVGTFWESATAASSRTSIKVKLVGGPMPYA